MKSVACFFILSKEPKLWTKMGEQPATLAAESIFSHIPRNWQKNRASNDLKVWRLGGRTATPSSWYEVRLWLEPFILLLFCWQLLWNSNRICACKVPLLFRRAFWSKILTSVIFEKQDFRFVFFFRSRHWLKVRCYNFFSAHWACCFFFHYSGTILFIL